MVCAVPKTSCGGPPSTVYVPLQVTCTYAPTGPVSAYSWETPLVPRAPGQPSGRVLPSPKVQS